VVAAARMSTAVRCGLVLLTLLAPAGCARREEAPHTVDELRVAIADYDQGKPAATEEQITALFARLDAEIAARRADEAAASPASREPITREVTTLETQRRDLQQAWIAARLKRFGNSAGDALRGLGETIGRGLEDAGRRLRESVQEGAGQAPPATEPAR
jgi:hypothetical protein